MGDLYLNQYQVKAIKFAKYDPALELMYILPALARETQELRDAVIGDGRDFAAFSDEVGDVLWMASAFLHHFLIKLNQYPLALPQGFEPFTLTIGGTIHDYDAETAYYVEDLGGSLLDLFVKSVRDNGVALAPDKQQKAGEIVAAILDTLARWSFAHGVPLEEVAADNLGKLSARYPDVLAGLDTEEIPAVF